MSEYYKKQLERLEDTEYGYKIKVSDGNGNSTKTMDINNESIKILKAWLDTLGVE